MTQEPEVWILRLGHRVFRDKRITTHLALVGRAFGASGIYIEGDADPKIKEKVEEVNKTWGGEFVVSFVSNWIDFVKKWKSEEGTVVHLTMYGLPFEDVINLIKDEKKKVLVIVGGKKVPQVAYEVADYNLAVTNQPHSEVAAIALFLDRYFEGKEPLHRNPKVKIVPTPRGKFVISRSLR
ncbi:MAG: tRNA (cytidine(56)-2'-O)-methyltransferase [Thermoproteota archaeon]